MFCVCNKYNRQYRRSMTNSMHSKTNCMNNLAKSVHTKSPTPGTGCCSVKKTKKLYD